MIESLADHGVDPMDLVPSLMTTHTVANPEYDPAEAQKKNAEELIRPNSDEVKSPPPTPTSPTSPSPHNPETIPKSHSLLNPGQSVLNQTTANVLQPNEATSVPGVSTTLSSTDENVTLDIRWTILCDLFLILIADSVYDARSRTLLESVASSLGLGWVDVVRFEKRVTDALEIQEAAGQLKQREVIEGREKMAKRKRYAMVGLATVGKWNIHSRERVPIGTMNSIRWWISDWSFCWFACTRNWGGNRCRTHHGRGDWNGRVPQWSWGRCCNHNWRSSYWLWHCSQRHGTSDTTSENV